ncbi:MAG: T9SS type A sorting domain-containing protein [Chitinophagaceae bacterium]|nr:T9SS type A sorting domain-containing protein [Chitinophagaceae bacterium]
MKTNGTQILIIRIILFVLISLYSLLVFGQPDYDFRSPALLSGTDRQVGAVYRFKNVKPGIHANVTITDMTNGLTINNIDGGSGFVEALQPVIVLPAGMNGYLEMKIDFIDGVSGLPSLQTEVPLTPIDVDGQVSSGRPINEYDMVQFISGYVDFDMLGGELSVGFPIGWVTGINTASIDYAGIDTTAKQVMFTVVNGNISSIIVRVGANNQTTSSQQRLRSIYFMRFQYPNSYLASPALISFTGNKTGDAVKLDWSLVADNNISTVQLERKQAAGDFQTIQEWQPGGETTSFNYTDNEPGSEKVYYRLKLIYASGKTEYSNILSFRFDGQVKQTINVYPTIGNGSFTANIYADKAQSSVLQWADMSGRVVHKQTIALQKGDNSVSVAAGNSPKGHYIISINMHNKIFSDRVIIQ